jgi:hypothetical protein
MTDLLEHASDTIRDLLSGTGRLLVSGLTEETINSLVCRSVYTLFFQTIRTG